jgi:hypothetical protein
MDRVRVVLAVGSMLLSGASFADPSDIHIKSAKYGDTVAGKTCDVNLSKMCDNLAVCGFTVTDTMCQVPAGTSQARNIEVLWTCGDSTQQKGRAAAKGTKIEIKCP